jgi:hypothetical protein
MTITRRLAALGVAGVIAVLGVGVFAGAADAAPRPAAAVGAPITVEPNPVAIDDSFTVSGEGCFPNVTGAAADVEVTFSVPDQFFSATPDKNGSWSVTIPADAVGEGTWTVSASCDGYIAAGDYAPGRLTVTAAAASSTTPTTSESTTTSEPTTSEPTTTQAPTTTAETTSSATVVSSASETASATASTTKSAAPPELTLVNFTGEVEQGGSFGIDATGFQPGENVTVTLHSDPVLLTTLIADDGGRASGTVTVPLDTAVGAHTITVVGELSGISLEAPITVVAAVETTVSQPSTAEVTSTAEPVVVTSTSGLANTGVNAAAMTIWGVVLLVAGGIAVALARKRDGKHAGD